MDGRRSPRRHPGTSASSALAHHALWDSWVHERDIVLPLGRTPVEEHDEIAANLRYVAALSPAFALNAGSVERGTLAVDVTEPDVSFVVEVDDRVSVRDGHDVTADVRFTGNAVELLEALELPVPARPGGAGRIRLDAARSRRHVRRRRPLTPRRAVGLTHPRARSSFASRFLSAGHQKS